MGLSYIVKIVITLFSLEDLFDFPLSTSHDLALWRVFPVTRAPCNIKRRNEKLCRFTPLRLDISSTISKKNSQEN